MNAFLQEKFSMEYHEHHSFKREVKNSNDFQVKGQNRKK